MQELPLSSTIALRIALAARELSFLPPARLLTILDELIGLPPTHEKLVGIKVNQFIKACEKESIEVDIQDVKNALIQLKGVNENDIEISLPKTQSYQEGDMPNSLRVACASDIGEEINGHFGSCKNFLIYQINKDEYRLIDNRLTKEDEVSDDKNEFRTNLIKDCQIVFVASIGGPAAAKVVKKGIHPIKYPHGGTADGKLKELQEILKQTPPPWLAKILGKDSKERFNFKYE